MKVENSDERKMLPKKSNVERFSLIFCSIRRPVVFMSCLLGHGDCNISKKPRKKNWKTSRNSLHLKTVKVIMQIQNTASRPWPLCQQCQCNCKSQLNLPKKQKINAKGFLEIITATNNENNHTILKHSQSSLASISTFKKNRTTTKNIQNHAKTRTDTEKERNHDTPRNKKINVFSVLFFLSHYLQKFASSFK